MASFNKVILLGNLTRDPQLKYLPSQTPVVEFGLACNRKFKSQSGEMREEVAFIECSAFGRQAEVINQYCQKGRPLFVEGRIKYDQWDDKQSGAKRSRLTVVVENFQLLGSGGGAGGPGGGGGYDETSQVRRPQQQRSGSQYPQQQQQQQEPFGDEPQFPDEDIPF